MSPRDAHPTDSPDTPPRSPREAAILWLSFRDAGLSPAEEAEYRSWLAADPRHAATIEALEPAWQRLNRARRAGHGRTLRREVAAIVARRRRRRILAGTTLAAAAALVAGLFLLRPGPVPPPRPDATVALRPDRKVLPDGSMVELNLGAVLAIEFTSRTRAVRLVRGEALFEVAKDPSRPFVVSAGRVAVRAVGTAFAVRVDPDTVDVLVTEGRVAVEHQRQLDPPIGAPGGAGPAERVIASAGDRLVLPAQASAAARLAPRRVSPAAIANALAWRQHRVEFDGTSLEDAVRLFNRDNALQLVVATPETAALRITGVFWTTDPEAFSRALEASLGLTATTEPGGRIVLRK